MKAPHPFLLITCGILSIALPVQALEILKGTSLSGKSIEAESARAHGDKNVLKDKDGREIVVKRAELIQGDLRCIEEVAPRSSVPMLVEKPVNPEISVLAYSFSRYLQSNTDRMVKYAQLLEKIDTGSQIPEPVDLANLYGFADVSSMEADWIAYINSSSFKKLEAERSCWVWVVKEGGEPLFSFSGSNICHGVTR
jgi:hypothetical protein